MKSLALFLFGFILYYPTFAQKDRRLPNSRPLNKHPNTARFNFYLNKAAGFPDNQKDSILYYTSRAFHIAKSAPYPIALAKYYHFMAAKYNSAGLYDSAMIASNNELTWALQSSDTSSIAWAYNAVANTYEFMGNMDSAAAYFFKGLKLTASNPQKFARL